LVTPAILSPVPFRASNASALHKFCFPGG